MTPVQYSGWVYVPVNVFNSQSTGVNFGLYYGLTENNTKLVLYNLSGKTMTFDLQNGTATAVGGEAPVPGKVLRQNGVYYVPAYAVCRYFGLSYSFYSTDYGPLLRLKDGNAMLSDSLFLSSAASIMRSRINSYYPVSYTHLDVYKRQTCTCSPGTPSRTPVWSVMRGTWSGWIRTR